MCFLFYKVIQTSYILHDQFQSLTHAKLPFVYACHVDFHILR